MSLRHLLLLLAVAAAFLYLRGPSAGRVVSNTVISPESGIIQYKAVLYEADWGPEIVHSGNIRLIERARYKPAPFFTHHGLITTGEFSDPEIVEVRHTGGGNFIWTAKERPEGTLVALHFVPRDRTALRALASLDDGDAVELIGREEVDGAVKGSDGSFLRLQHDNHRYLLVESVKRTGE
ncbi:MAG: hypothetical protein ACE5GX_09125 [Thermoanaerobaculia bacterium]